MSDRDLPALAWWDPIGWTPGWFRVAVDGGIGLATAFVITWTVDELGDHLRYHYPLRVLSGTLLGLLAGLATGLAAEQQRTGGPAPGRAGVFNAGIAVACGLMVGWIVGRMIDTHHGLGTALPLAVPAALITAVVCGFTSGGATRVLDHDRSRPVQALTWLAINVNLGIAAATALPIGLGVAFYASPALSVPTGLFAGLVFGLVDRRAHEPVTAVEPAGFRQSWTNSRRRALLTAVVFGGTIAVGNGVFSVADKLPYRSVRDAVVLGLTPALLVGAGTAVAAWVVTSVTWRARLAFVYLFVRNRLPRSVLAFLTRAADDHGILRAAGPLLEFRHAHLRQRLAAETAPSTVERPVNGPVPPSPTRTRR